MVEGPVPTFTEVLGSHIIAPYHLVVKPNLGHHD